MKIELTDITECKKALDVEIPLDIVDHEITHIAQELARKARVPGFRPGKAPIPVIKTRYRDEIVSEMMQHLLPKYFSEAAHERKLDIVDSPQYEKVDYVNGQPLKFTAVFEVYPQLNISNYTGIPAETAIPTVEDSEVEATLRKLQEDMSEMTPTEETHAIQNGDFAEISFKGVVQDSDEPPLTLEKGTLEVGGPTTLQEFSDNLAGARAHEERTFTVRYLDDYPEKRLAGKTVDYTVKVEDVKQKKIPELNDEFAQGLGDYKTLQDLRDKIRQDMEKHKLEHARDEMRDKLLQWLENNNTFEVPESLVQRQIQIRMQRLARDLARQGVDPQRLDVDWKKIRDDQYQQSVRDVKSSLILDYVAEQEKVDVDDQEVENELQKIAAETQRPVEKVREVLSRESGLERLKGQIRNKKTLDFLQARAQISEPPSNSNNVVLP